MRTPEQIATDVAHNFDTDPGSEIYWAALQAARIARADAERQSTATPEQDRSNLRDRLG